MAMAMGNFSVFHIQWPNMMMADRIKYGPNVDCVLQMPERTMPTHIVVAYTMQNGRGVHVRDACLLTVEYVIKLLSNRPMSVRNARNESQFIY